jgi:hypothetical protein
VLAEFDPDNDDDNMAPVYSILKILTHPVAQKKTKQVHSPSPRAHSGRNAGTAFLPLDRLIYRYGAKNGADLASFRPRVCLDNILAVVPATVEDWKLDSVKLATIRLNALLLHCSLNYETKRSMIL